jgi:hypothetical protein
LIPTGAILIQTQTISTTWQDDNGNYLGAHHVPYYVLGDVCYDGQAPCKWFYYA